MKKIFCLFLIIVLVFSCAPKKVVTATKTETKSVIQNDIEDHKVEQTNTKILTVDKSNVVTETTTETITYDSDKPNVPGTDKPPVKEVKKITEKKTNNGDIKVNMGISAKSEANHKDNSKSNDNNKSDVVVKETPKTPWIAYVAWIIGILAICVGLFFLRRYWTKVKSIFAKI